MRRRAACLIILCLAASRPAAAEEPLSLEAAYALALKRSETIAIDQEAIKEAEARFIRAFGTALPNISFVLSEKRQDGTGESAFTLRRVPERKFVFTQPIFSGFREFAAIAGSRAEQKQRRYEKQRAEHILLVDVANALYLLAELRQDLGTLEQSRMAVVDRIDELRNRLHLGRSRPSEVASAESQLRRIESDLEAARGRETSAEQLLAFLTGLPSIDSVADPGPLPGPSQPESFYASQAVSRPDVLAVEQAWSVARKQVGVEQADLWPNVDLEANYYTERAGVAAQVDWDALLTVDVPIFQGGEAVGGVREALSKARQAKLRSGEAKREAVLDAQNAYADLQAATAQHASLERALAAAEEDYRLQVEDYRLNLVNNLDVLQALQILLNTRRDVIHSRFEVLRRYWALQAASGHAVKDAA